MRHYDFTADIPDASAIGSYSDVAVYSFVRDYATLVDDSPEVKDWLKDDSERDHVSDVCEFIEGVVDELSDSADELVLFNPSNWSARFFRDLVADCAVFVYEYRNGMSLNRTYDFGRRYVEIRNGHFTAWEVPDDYLGGPDSVPYAKSYSNIDPEYVE